MDRPKRQISKPSRLLTCYLTTSSSDDAPKRQKALPTNAARGEIQDDIDDIRNILDKDHDKTFDNNDHITQHESSHIHKHIDTNIPSHVIPPYSSQSFNTSMPSSYVPSVLS